MLKGFRRSHGCSGNQKEITIHLGIIDVKRREQWLASIFMENSAVIMKRKIYTRVREF